ncbi:hypothetical protein GY45DRAFT_221235 [Cubamyces sp. BRFM 1775]|nr:hypothetical protein GY45DRAFT_221235 [Cubamyces sp. BRFM 1775]
MSHMRMPVSDHHPATVGPVPMNLNPTSGVRGMPFCKTQPPSVKTNPSTSGREKPHARLDTPPFFSPSLSLPSRPHPSRLLLLPRIHPFSGPAGILFLRKLWCACLSSRPFSPLPRLSPFAPPAKSPSALSPPHRARARARPVPTTPCLSCARRDRRGSISRMLSMTSTPRRST